MTEQHPETNPAQQSPPGLSRSQPVSFGRPRKRDQQSLKDYDRVAQQIVDQIHPETVLDIGCGTGLLVERLRRRRIAAVGIDPDEALLDQADPKTRPFLSRADYTANFSEGPFSLIVCIEALTDLPADQATAAVRSICDRTDDVVFSAGRPGMGDGSEGTGRSHSFWAGLFADRGFFRATEFDASFISPWAIRFRRRADMQIADLVREYEDAFLPLKNETTALRAHVKAQDLLIERARNEYNLEIKQLQRWETQWADLELSTGWRMLHFVRLLRMRLAPPGGRLNNLLLALRDSFLGPEKQGLAVFFRRLRRGFNSQEFLAASTGETTELINAERYLSFVERTTPGLDELERQRAQTSTWKQRPLISFITPVYKPSLEVLRATLDSVLAQTYDNWELCLADASPDSPPIRQLLAEFAGQDARMRVQFLDHNLGISANSNAAFGMASGEFIAILDHDDVLAPHMLFEVVSRIRENDQVDVIYFDEDKLSEDGTQRRDPFFKPDFSPEMLISANYLTHAVYRRSLVEDVGRFSPAYDGCQDWDLAFKITEKTNRIEHIPKVLYHWRQVGGSTAGEFTAKTYVFNRQLRCVEDHLRRTGILGPRASFPVPGFLRAVWPVSGGKVSIIIPTRDKVDYLERTISSINELTDYQEYEFIIVDNGSRATQTLRYFDTLRSASNVRIIDFKETFNYSRANNLGAQVAEGDYLLFLNNDIEILHGDWMEELVRWAELPAIGVVGAKLMYPDNTVQHAGVVIGLEGHASHIFWGYHDRQSGPFGSVDWYRNFSAVTGACMMMRRATFEAVGGFDEKYILAFSDIELCLRTIEHGYRVVYTPYSRLRHYESKSRGDHIPSHDILVGMDDFIPLIEQGDPFFNPNLSYSARTPMIRPAEEESRVSRLHRVTTDARVYEST